MALEKDIEGAASDILWDEYGVPSIKLTMITDSGWPDRLYILPQSRVKFVEYKRPGEEPQPRQEYIHELLAAFGHEVEVYDSITDAVQGVTKTLESGSATT